MKVAAKRCFAVMKDPFVPVRGPVKVPDGAYNTIGSMVQQIKSFRMSANGRKAFLVGPMSDGIDTGADKAFQHILVDGNGGYDENPHYFHKGPYDECVFRRCVSYGARLKFLGNTDDEQGYFEATRISPSDDVADVKPDHSTITAPLRQLDEYTFVARRVDKNLDFKSKIQSEDMQFDNIFINIFKAKEGSTVQIQVVAYFEYILPIDHSIATYDSNSIFDPVGLDNCLTDLNKIIKAGSKIGHKPPSRRKNNSKKSPVKRAPKKRKKSKTCNCKSKKTTKK